VQVNNEQEPIFLSTPFPILHPSFLHCFPSSPLSLFSSSFHPPPLPWGSTHSPTPLVHPGAMSEHSKLSKRGPSGFVHFNLKPVRDEWSLLGAIGIHLTVILNPNPNPTPNPDPTPNPNPNPNPIGSYTVYMWNNRRNVFLWRPVNSTLPTGDCNLHTTLTKLSHPDFSLGTSCAYQPYRDKSPWKWHKTCRYQTLHSPTNQ